MKLIVPVAGGPELLELPADAAAGNISRLAERHREVASLLAGYSCLVFRSNEDYAGFHSALAALPQFAQAEWEHALQYTRIRILQRPPVPKSLENVRSKQDLQVWAQWVGVACVPRAAWQELQAREVLEAEDWHSFKWLRPAPPKVIEALRTSHFELRKTEALKQARRLAAEVEVPPGTNREVLRDRYLQPLFTYATRVTIVDAYLSDELMRWRPEYGEGALEWTLRAIHESAFPIWHEQTNRWSGADIDLITTIDSRDHALQVETAVEKVVERVLKGAKMGLERVRLFHRPRDEHDIHGHRDKPQHGRYIEVVHGALSTDFGRVKGRLADATTHLRLDLGLTPLRAQHYDQTWYLHYTTPIYQLESHDARIAAVNRAYTDCGRRSASQWVRPADERGKPLLVPAGGQ